MLLFGRGLGIAADPILIMTEPQVVLHLLTRGRFCMAAVSLREVSKKKPPQAMKKPCWRPARHRCSDWLGAVKKVVYCVSKWLFQGQQKTVKECFRNPLTVLQTSMPDLAEKSIIPVPILKKTLGPCEREGKDRN